MIGARFGADLLAALGTDPVFDQLLGAELIDQVQFTPVAEYAFRHPLIRAVAYESQLKSGRAEWHRRLATAIQERAPGSVEENAAQIAEHLESAGELHEAYGWHMRAGEWSTNRDIGAAHASWQRARQVADLLPGGDPDRTAMRIAPRALLCGHSWRAGGASIADTCFDELRELCTAAGDQISLVMGTSGVLVAMSLNDRLRELQSMAPEYVRLLESTGDPALILLLNTVTFGTFKAGDVARTLPLFQRAIDVADGDPILGNFFFESPLAWVTTLRGLARCSLGQPGWRDDLQTGLAMAREVQGVTQAAVTTYGYTMVLMNGAMAPDATTLRNSADALRAAERSGDDTSLAWKRVSHGIMLIRLPDGDKAAGIDLLAKGRQHAFRRGDLLTVTMADIQTAEWKADTGDVDAAIEIAGATVEHVFDCGEAIFRGPASAVLVESLLRRGTENDLREAQHVIDRLAASPADPGFVLYELPLLRLRALMARARNDQQAYREFAQRYREMAKTLGFKGHTARAEALT
ncbi:hypothetical protein [Mycobacterium sp.]|uniref:hypothetical protein n=1 Tax=Mycobacterium sp. TaxID=1785 RepID=UPI002B9B662B|nr:hypothetical protein [Mycobacterium sp.]HTQ22820.1 hypothetical protein [Mycobacterium sp.]